MVVQSESPSVAYGDRYLGLIFTLRNGTNLAGAEADVLINGMRRQLRLTLGGFILSLAVAGPALAQEAFRITGNVTDTSGAAIVGAAIRVSGPGAISRRAVSDPRGEFSFEGFPTGAYVVEVERRQFNPAAISVQLSGSSPRADLRVVLQPAGVLENVTVIGAPYAPRETRTGSKITVPAREVPNSISVLTRAQMTDQNMVTPWDALSQMTGVTAISNDGTQSQFHARGGALELQLDGMPSAQSLSGNQQYDLAIYERVEVQRGPAGLLQGAGSFSGTVNLVRRRPTATRSASATVSTGQWDNHHAEMAVSGPLTDSLRGLAVVAGTDREFFYDRGRDRKWLGYGALEWSPDGATRLGGYAIRQHDRNPGFTGLPTYTDGGFLFVSRSFNPYPAWNRMEWGTTDFGLDVERRIGDAWRLTAQVNRRKQALLFHDSFPFSGVDRATHVIREYERREFTFDYTADTADVYLDGRFTRLGATHQWLVGANAARFESIGRGVNSSSEPALSVRDVILADPPPVAEPTFTYRTGSASRTRQSGVYTLLRTRIRDRLSTVVGGRWSNFDAHSRSIAPSVATDWQPGAKSRMEFTPHAGAVLDVVRDLSLYGSYSEIFVAQTQRHADGRVLDPRVGHQWEIGAKGEHLDGRLLTSLAAFRIRDRHRAYPDPLNPGFFVPLGEVESRGWETEISGRIVNTWDLSAGYTWLETEFLVHQSLVGQPLSYWYPRHSLKSWSTWRVPATALEGLKVGLGVQAYSSSASGSDTRNAAGVVTVAARRQSAYAVASLNASYPVGRNLQMGVQVNNLFDRRYYTRLGGTNAYNWFGEPRSAIMFLRWFTAG